MSRNPIIIILSLNILFWFGIYKLCKQMTIPWRFVPDQRETGCGGGVNSEVLVNCSVVVDWRGWSCDAGVVFSAATRSCEPVRDAVSCSGPSVRGSTPNGLPQNPRTSPFFPLPGHYFIQNNLKSRRQLFASEESARGCLARVQREKRARLMISV